MFLASLLSYDPTEQRQAAMQLLPLRESTRLLRAAKTLGASLPVIVGPGAGVNSHPQWRRATASSLISFAQQGPG